MFGDREYASRLSNRRLLCLAFDVPTGRTGDFRRSPFLSAISSGGANHSEKLPTICKLSLNIHRYRSPSGPGSPYNTNGAQKCARGAGRFHHSLSGTVPDRRAARTGIPDLEAIPAGDGLGCCEPGAVFPTQFPQQAPSRRSVVRALRPNRKVHSAGPKRPAFCWQRQGKRNRAQPASPRLRPITG